VIFCHADVAILSANRENLSHLLSLPLTSDTLSCIARRAMCHGAPLKHRPARAPIYLLGHQMISLRPYQRAAVDASIGSRWRRHLVVLPTGGGKTIVGMSIAREIGGRCLWLAHTDELVTQPQQAARLVWPEADRGVVKADRNEYMRQIVFASIQSAQQARRLDQLARERFDLVVCDEAHRGLSRGYRALFDALGCNRDDGPRLLGLTATPERTDGGALEEVFDGIAFQMGVTTAIDAGYLVRPNVVSRPIDIDLDAVTRTHGDYSARELDVALMQAGIVDEIVSAYEQYCATRKTLIFTVSVQQSEMVSAALRQRGHLAASVSGQTDRETRRSILRRLSSGDLRCVSNCAVLTEGFDEPSVDSVILARPTQSKPLMIQMVGRALRLFPGKEEALVLDLVGVSKRNSMIQAAVIFGQATEERETKKRALDPITDPEEYWRQRLLSQIEGVSGAPRSKLRWIRGAEGGWLLPAADHGTVRMTPASGDSWSVDAVGVKIGERATLELTRDPVSLETAQAIAEDFVRRVANAVGLASAAARWRDDPASEAQVALLGKLGVKGGERMSKGTAADLITQHSAKRDAEPATPRQLALLRRHGVDCHGITKREAMREIARLKA
jgi:ATP-dependent helicase IRC3